jgi:hypothetical protein
MPVEKWFGATGESQRRRQSATADAQTADAVATMAAFRCGAIWVVAGSIPRYETIGKIEES